MSLSSSCAGLIGAVVFIGIFFGCVWFGIISDTKGRRVAYLATALFTGTFLLPAVQQIFSCCIMMAKVSSVL